MKNLLMGTLVFLSSCAAVDVKTCVVYKDAVLCAVINHSTRTIEAEYKGFKLQINYDPKTTTWSIAGAANLTDADKESIIEKLKSVHKDIVEHKDK